MENLKVQKLKLQAQVSIRGKRMQRGFFFVIPPAYPIPNSRLLLQLLNESHEFVPLERAKKITLINKQQVIFLRLPPEKPEETDAGILRRKIRVVLPTQLEITGTVFIDLPEEHQRVLDFVNLKAAFFVLSSSTGMYIVNKSMILEAAPFDTK